MRPTKKGLGLKCHFQTVKCIHVNKTAQKKSLMGNIIFCANKRNRERHEFYYKSFTYSHKCKQHL